MHLLLLLLADLALVGGASDDCALARALVPALDSYCATHAAPSEQHSCRIARTRLRTCSTTAEEPLSVWTDPDGQVEVTVHDERVDGPCGLSLTFTKRRNGYRLDSFSKPKSVCACDCCP